MKHLLRLTDLDAPALEQLFGLADEYAARRGPTFDAAAALFFPPASIRTRASFERGLALMGVQPILFPPETLDKPEDLRDVAGYLAQFCRIAVVRHADLGVLDRLAGSDQLPVVNAMTNANHPCEVLADLWALSRRGLRVTDLRYVVVGCGDSNLVGAGAAAATAFGLDLIQTAPAGHAHPGLDHTDDIRDAVRGADVVITDPPGRHADIMAPYRVTLDLLEVAGPHCLLNPCPPFVRGREVGADAIDSPHWVGYDFKHALLPVQQAIVATGLS